MKWFAGCKTQEEIKKEYRRLCFIHHPDKGGETSVMQEINAEYARASANATRREQPDWTEAQYRTAATVAEEIREAIERIVTLQGLQIEICGLWVWVGGNTRVHKEALKAAGYKWASKKKKWYFAGVPAGGYGWSMDKIRSRYGSQRVPVREDEKEKANA